MIILLEQEPRQRRLEIQGVPAFHKHLRTNTITSWQELQSLNIYHKHSTYSQKKTNLSTSLDNTSHRGMRANLQSLNISRQQFTQPQDNKNWNLSTSLNNTPQAAAWWQNWNLSTSLNNTPQAAAWWQNWNLSTSLHVFYSIIMLCQMQLTYCDSNCCVSLSLHHVSKAVVTSTTNITFPASAFPKKTPKSSNQCNHSCSSGITVPAACILVISPVMCQVQS